jgi:hypothetical protein
MYATYTDSSLATDTNNVKRLHTESNFPCEYLELPTEHCEPCTPSEQWSDIDIARGISWEFALLGNVTEQLLRPDCLCRNYGGVTSQGEEIMWTVKPSCPAPWQIYFAHAIALNSLWAMADRQKQKCKCKYFIAKIPTFCNSKTVLYDLHQGSNDHQISYKMASNVKSNM